MQSDIRIAQSVNLIPVTQVGIKLGIPGQFLESYGPYKAKVSLEYLSTLSPTRSGKLILVTAMSPTPAGEGKTTTTIGLGDALCRIGKKAIICLREPSLGPVFGMKGGAAGGGYSQVVPMEDINLHFTGDFNAIQLANNLLAALIDNHIHHGNELGFDTRRVTWRRVLDMNDRALREMTLALGGAGNGYPRQSGFDIVVASEVMAILCLADSWKDLKLRLSKIVVGETQDRRFLRASELKAQGAMTVLLKDALKPNLVQTLEHNPALIHGGPFANIAHGCSSVIATQSGLKLADYVVTEAGFGADLGAEKFVDIKCRQSGLRPAAAVVVATVRALKYQGGAEVGSLRNEDLSALQKGMVNLERHVDNVRNQYGIRCVVAVNHFSTDTEAELESVRRAMSQRQVQVLICSHWEQGSRGAQALAEAVVGLAEGEEANLKFVYRNEDSLWDKAHLIVTRIYGASELTASSQVRKQIDRLQRDGFGHFPVCIAKTQYSFSTDPQLRGAPSGHQIEIREVRLAAGAEFVVFVCGEIMTMPGLPKVPSSTSIDLDEQGRVIGLF